jgi:alpha-tubulin suppressor-like RCC1 family protein
MNPTHAPSLPIRTQLPPRPLVLLVAFLFPLLSQAAGLVAGWGDGSLGQTLVPAAAGTVRAFAAGANHNLALKSDGTVIGWGRNDFQQAEAPAGLRDVVALGAGTDHSLALTASGTVVAWGWNVSGQASVPPGLAPVTGIAAGATFSLALLANGRVTTWGDNTHGQINVPTTLSNAVAIAASGNHSLALKADGTIVAWGNYMYGETTGQGGLTNLPPGLTNVIAIAAGWTHSLALRDDGTVVAWGANTYGQTTVPAGLTQVTAIAAGAYHCLARRADGTVVAWGRNTSGQTNVPAGLTGVTAIAAGAGHSLALVQSGPVRILSGPVDQTVTVNSGVVLAVTAQGDAPLSFQWFRDGLALNDTANLSGSTNATLTLTHAGVADMGTYSVAVGNAFGSVISAGALLKVEGPPVILNQSPDLTAPAGSDVPFAVAAAGTPVLTYRWQFNGTNLLSGTSATPMLNTTLALTNVQSAHAGTYTLFVSNAFGEARADLTLSITASAPTIRSHPQNVGTLPIGGNATFAVSARGTAPLSYQWRLDGVDIPSATNSILALAPLRVDQSGHYNVVVRNPLGEVVSAKAALSVGQVLAWSPNVFSTPMPTNLFPALTNITAVARADYHVMGLKSDGTVVVWFGDSYYGTPAVTNIPVGLGGVMAISAGASHCLALRSNGTVAAWGTGGGTSVPPGLSNLIAIAAGPGYSLALRSNGTVVGWGQLSSGPINVPAGLSNVVAISAGQSHCLALINGGTVAAWGRNVPGPNDPPADATNLIAIAASQYYSYGLKEDGTVMGWGLPGPRLPAGASSVVAIAAGATQGALALTAEGTVLSSYFQQEERMPVLTNVIGIARSFHAVALIGSGAPVFTIQPYSRVAGLGGAAAFHARAAGRQPMSYQWQRNGQNLTGATSASLMLTNLQGANGGEYRLVASNELGTAVSMPARLTIPHTLTLAEALNTTNFVWTSSGFAAPWFAQFTESHDGESAAQSGQISHPQWAVLNTSVSGPGTLAWWWKVSSEPAYDFLEFALNGIMRTRISGESDWQRLTFSVPAGNHTLSWIYRKDASVSTGQDVGWLDEVSFTPDPPVIGQQPVSQTRWMGESVTFQANAIGAPPLSYQWLRTGTDLPGATGPSLTLSNLTRRDSAAYAVRVANPGGTTLSSNATLVVQVPQQLTPPVRLQDGNVGFAFGDADGGWLEPGDVAGMEVQTSTNLAAWSVFTSPLLLTNGVVWVHDLESTNWPARFYRVMER